MSILVVAEHDNQTLNPVTLNVLAAAAAVGGDVHVLVAGKDCGGVADAAAAAAGVGKVLCADNDAYAHQLAENVAPLIAGLGKDYGHVIGAHSTGGKNAMPRVAAQLDVAMISDVIGVDAPDTFKRPIYAGNAIATVQSEDAIKVLTVRHTAFDPVAGEGGSASVDSQLTWTASWESLMPVSSAVSWSGPNAAVAGP